VGRGATLGVVDWPWEIAECDHEIQTALSPEKIRRLGGYLRLNAATPVLDVACGKGGPARILASTTAAGSRGSSSAPSSRTRDVPWSRRPASVR
jgi:hypothetical protein